MLPLCLIPDLVEYLPRCEALRKLEITMDKQASADLEALLLSALCSCHSFRNVYLFDGYSLDDYCEERFSASFIKQLFVSHSCTLEALQVSLQKPLKNTFELAITEVFIVLFTN